MKSDVLEGKNKLSNQTKLKQNQRQSLDKDINKENQDKDKDIDKDEIKPVVLPQREKGKEIDRKNSSLNLYLNSNLNQKVKKMTVTCTEFNQPVKDIKSSDFRLDCDLDSLLHFDSCVDASSRKRFNSFESYEHYETVFDTNSSLDELEVPFIRSSTDSCIRVFEFEPETEISPGGAIGKRRIQAKRKKKTISKAPTSTPLSIDDSHNSHWNTDLTSSRNVNEPEHLIMDFNSFTFDQGMEQLCEPFCDPLTTSLPDNMELDPLDTNHNSHQTFRSRFQSQGTQANRPMKTKSKKSTNGSSQSKTKTKAKAKTKTTKAKMKPQLKLTSQLDSTIAFDYTTPFVVNNNNNTGGLKHNTKPIKKLNKLKVNGSINSTGNKNKVKLKSKDLGKDGKKLRRTKWSKPEIKNLWEGISKHGNNWMKIENFLASGERSYEQVKDKGRRLLFYHGWQTGRKKEHANLAKNKAQEIADGVLVKLQAAEMDFGENVNTIQTTALISEKPIISQQPTVSMASNVQTAGLNN